MTQTPALGPIQTAIIVVPPGRAGAWRMVTGWRAEAAPLGADLAARIGHPQLAGAPAMQLIPWCGYGGVLLIEHPAAITPFRRIGWAAAEFSVTHLQQLANRAQAQGFELVGPPRPLGSGGSISACQLADQGGAVMYCADVREYAGAADLARAVNPFERMFIAVLATRDLEATRAWYRERFGLAQISDHAVPIPVINAAWGQPADDRWRISSQQLADGCLIEIDQYPADADGLAEADAPAGIVAIAMRSGEEATLVGPSGERLLLTRETALIQA